jgi:predicted nucleic acid-binding protein
MFYKFYNNLIYNIETIYEEILQVKDMAKVVYLQVLQEFIKTLEENKQEKLKHILDKQFIF